MQQAPMDPSSMLLYGVNASILRLDRFLFQLRGMMEW
jgi:hypothetical protein